MYAADLVAYLQELKKNNNKLWFDAHRDRYDNLRSQFAGLVTRVITTTARTDASVSELTAAQCLFQINRDIRFSKDKSPYKTTFSATLAVGPHGVARPGYYFHIDAEGDLVVGAGLHDPDTQTLQRIRYAIDREGSRLASIAEVPAFQDAFGDLGGEQLKSVPREFAPDHPYGRFLRYKSFTVDRRDLALSLTDDALPNRIAGLFAVASPLVAYLREVIAG
ncbi:MAG: DUF2461 domain-containing protein [Capsulimonadaceae bacterium]